MIIINGWKPLIIITKRSILDVAAVLDPPLTIPEKMKIAKITLIFTSSKERLLINCKTYKAMSMLPWFSKILERIMC